MYHVYFCNGVESSLAVVMPSFKPAIFDSLVKAISFVDVCVSSLQRVCSNDNVSMGSSRVCWYEIYLVSDNAGNSLADGDVLGKLVYSTYYYYNE